MFERKRLLAAILSGMVATIISYFGEDCLPTYDVDTFNEEFEGKYKVAVEWMPGPAEGTTPISLHTTETGWCSPTFAALVISILPTITIYIIMQEQIMESVVPGSVKG